MGDGTCCPAAEFSEGHASYLDASERQAQQGAQISTCIVPMFAEVTQAMDMNPDPTDVGTWTQTWPLATVRGPSPCSFAGPSDWHGPMAERPLDTNIATVASQTPGISIAFDGIRIHSHQHRP